MALSEFFEGVTKLPRELAGGAAIALGADRKRTKDLLGLDERSSLLEQVKSKIGQPSGIIDAIEKEPAKFIGELVPYVFLPMRLFGKATGKALKERAKKTKNIRHRAVAAADEIGHMGVAFGTYGAVEEMARAKIDGRESEVANQFVQDGLFAVGFGTALKTAFLGAEKIKSRVGKSKYIKDVLMDAGVPPKAASGISKMSDADKRIALQGLEEKLSNTKLALAATMNNTLPGMKLKPIGREGSKLKQMTSDAFGELSPKVKEGVEKVAQKPHNQRPIDLPKEGKANIAEEARRPVAKLRASADDMNAHLGSIARHANNAKVEIIQLIPDLAKREKITAALDINGAKYMKSLSPDEQMVAKQIRTTFNQMGHALQEKGIIKGFREEYIPHILNQSASGEQKTLQEMLDSVSKRTHTSTTTARGLKRKVENTPLHERADAKTLDIAEILQLYTHQVGHATAMRNIFDKLNLQLIPHNSMIISKTRTKHKIPDNYVLLDYEKYKPVITEYIKANKLMRPYAKKLHDEVDEELLGSFNTMSKSEREYAISEKKSPKYQKIHDEMFQERANELMPKFFEQEAKNAKLYVHPDYKPSLDLLFQQVNIGDTMKAVIFANFASKRALVMGSLFHFNALAESALFAGAGGIGAVAKGAGTGFLLTGGNPLGAAVGGGLGAGVRVLTNTRNITAQLRGGKYGDMYDYALRYIDIKPPRDVGTDEFYNGLSSIQGMIDKYVPTNTARGVLKKGTKAVGGINKAIDVLMWHRLMSGAKLIVFQRNLERLAEKNMLLPKAEKRSQHELATIAGQFVNDAFGGQNWRKLAENVDNAWGRRIAAAMSTPNGQKWANLIMFAPDWTISNLRILAKAFPGINNDKLSRQIYQRYATRAAIYYMIMGSAIQMMLTGKPIFANDDPTKLDLGDGRTMTFSKQLMEPFHWIADPAHTATVKQSSALKIVEEFTTNKKWVGGGPATPKVWDEDDSPIEKTAKGLELTGKHFAPIFVQDIGRNGMEGVYGFFGHPIYGSIRHGFKNSDGKIE